MSPVKLIGKNQNQNSVCLQTDRCSIRIPQNIVAFVKTLSINNYFYYMYIICEPVNYWQCKCLMLKYLIVICNYALHIMKYPELVYSTQVNSTFRVLWLANSEVISKVLFTSEQPKRKKMATCLASATESNVFSRYFI